MERPWHDYKRRIYLRWRKRWVRLVVTILIILLATILQYYVTQIPEPISVEANNSQYTPAQAKAQSDTLVIQSPTTASPGQALLSIDGSENEIFEFHADVARLSSETLEFLNELVKSSQPPAAFERTDYFLAEDKQAEPTTDSSHTGGTAHNPTNDSTLDQPCKMYLRVYPVDMVPTAIRFYKPEYANAHFQPVIVSFEGADVAVHIKQRNPERNNGSDPWGIGCKKTLQIKDWTLTNNGHFDLMFIVQAGSAVRFDFSTTSESTSFVDSYEPFKLGEGSLKASGIAILQNEPVGKRAFEVSASGQQNGLLNLSRLVSNEEKLELSYSGVGIVKINGESAKTFSLFHLINESPIVAGLLGLANTALLGWLVHNMRKTH